MEVRGFKVFNHDWTCSPRGNLKQYACPGDFTENVSLSLCGQGMHFCRKAVDCFNYYCFSPNNKVAEVVAYGDVAEQGDKCCTNKLRIIREISWSELLDIVNTGRGCSGFGNSGNRNSGNRNSGDCNSGDWNSGDWNSGNRNSGDCNSGDRNSGNRNSGNWNSGDCNSGDRNSGNRNSGNWNSGDCNSGDWNRCSFSNGCFNTVTPTIYLFNKPSKWSYYDWKNSNAYHILRRMPDRYLKWVLWDDMTDEERERHSESKNIGGYLKAVYKDDRMDWWRGLNSSEKNAILSIPNFDKEIFKEITGIDVEE